MCEHSGARRGWGELRDSAALCSLPSVEWAVRGLSSVLRDGPDVTGGRWEGEQGEGIQVHG